MAAGKQGMEIGNEGEDCLVLNVYTPDASPAR
jgi:para-nitrobenzyl esterase